MVLPSPFSTTSQYVATYDYRDIVDGTGIVDSYLATAITSVGTTYILTTDTLSSADLSLNVDATYLLSAFNTPRDLKGTVYIFGSTYRSGSGTHYLTFQLKKNGTNIGSAVSTPTYSTSLNNYLVPIAMTGTHFAAGDVLSIAVTITKTDVGVAWYGTDPASRSTTGLLTASRTTIKLPFRIDQ